MSPEQEKTDALFSLLIAALTQYANTGNWQPWPFDKGYTQCCLDWMLAEKALKAIPAELLERERKREAVIQAAIDLMASTDPALNGVMHPLEMALDDAVGEYESFLNESE